MKLDHWTPTRTLPAIRGLEDVSPLAGTPTAPWGVRRLPHTLEAGSARRTLFRELLRRSEGVAVVFPDGTAGRVAEVVFPVLGFDFWPEALLVGTTDGKRRVPVSAVASIDTRPPRIEVSGVGGDRRA